MTQGRQPNFTMQSKKKKRAVVADVEPDLPRGENWWTLLDPTPKRLEG